MQGIMPKFLLVPASRLEQVTFPGLSHRRVLRPQRGDGGKTPGAMARLHFAN